MIFAAVSLALGLFVSMWDFAYSRNIEQGHKTTYQMSLWGGMIAESVNKSKTIIKQKLNRVLTVMEVYRTLGNGNKEVLVRIAYNAGSATDIAKKAIKEDLKAKGEALTDELNALLSE